MSARTYTLALAVLTTTLAVVVLSGLTHLFGWAAVLTYLALAGKLVLKALVGVLIFLGFLIAITRIPEEA
jgi:hypothetical protein